MRVAGYKLQNSGKAAAVRQMHATIQPQGGAPREFTVAPHTRKQTPQAPQASSPINTMEGEVSSATRNSSLTSFGPSPKYLFHSDRQTHSQRADHSTKAFLLVLALGCTRAGTSMPAPRASDACIKRMKWKARLSLLLNEL